MYKLIFTLLFLPIFLYSEQPTAMEFEFGNQPPQVFNPNDYIQKTIVHGFQWSGTPQMDEALGNNVRTSGNIHGKDLKSDDTLAIVFQPSYNNSTGYVPAYFWAPFMEYEPTLPLNDNNFGEVLRPEDPANPVFGFKYRKGTILTNSSDENYSRLILKKDSLASYGGNTVLKEIYPQPHFKSRLFNEVSNQTDMYYGRKWYLSANIRRLNPKIDNVINNDIVLSFKVRYWINGIPGMMQFDSIPIQNENAFSQKQYMQDRGKYQNLMKQSLDSIIVRNRILPITNDKTDITISGAFFTASDMIKNADFGTDPGDIDSIDIEVNYFGNLDVAIDWVRIETMRAHYLLMGVADSIDINNRESIILEPDPKTDTSVTTPKNYTELHDIKSIFETALDSVYRATNAFRGGQLFRFYFQDVESDKYYWWGPLRYANLLTNNMFITRDNYVHPKLYEHYTRCSERWVGMYLRDWDAAIATPYMRFGWQGSNKTPASSMLIKNGFKGRSRNTIFQDSLNSDYETFLDPSIDINSDYDYFVKLPKVESNIQPIWETRLYNFYYNNDTKAKELIYTNKNWWLYSLFNSGMLSKWEYQIQDPNNSNQTITVVDTTFVWNTYRAKTAEEFRLQWHSSMLRGCKGFVYDGDHQTDVAHQKKIGLRLGIGDTNKLALYPLLSREVGDDFINLEYNTWNLETDSTHFSHVDTTAFYAGIDRDRVYIGTRSIRSELYKLHTFLDLMSDKLMDLRPFASLSKGYRLWKNWDERFSETDVWYSYIEFDTTKLFTKKIWDPNTRNYTNMHERFDSSFFDLSLLRYSHNGIHSNKFVMGIQNRRTDPLLFMTSGQLNATFPEGSMIFISSAEFDDFVQNGGELYKNDTWYSSTFWKDQWWKRLGCRQLSVPIKFKADNNPDYFSGRYYEIKEMGYDNTELRSKYWIQDDLYQMIDTVIKENEAFTANLLPGQGKLVEIEAKFLAQTQDYNDVECSSCSNASNNLIVQKTNEIGNCFDLIITNESECYYEDLNLLFIADTAMTNIALDVEDSAWDVVWGEEYYNIKELEGELGPHETVEVSVCINNDEKLNYEITLGIIKDSILIRCEETIYQGEITNACYIESIEVNKDNTACEDTGGCGWAIACNLKFYEEGERFGLRVKNEDGTYGNLSEKDIYSDWLTEYLCYCETKKEIEFYIKDLNGDIRCNKKLHLTCDPCEDLVMEEGVPDLSPNVRYNDPNYFIAIDELYSKFGITAHLVDQQYSGHCVWFKTLHLNGMGCMVDKVITEEYDINNNQTPIKTTDGIISDDGTKVYLGAQQRSENSHYVIAILGKDNDTICKKEFDRKWKRNNPFEVQVSPFSQISGSYCVTTVDAVRTNILNDDPEVFGIIIFDVANHNEMLYYNAKDPSANNPFDFSTQWEVASLKYPSYESLDAKIVFYDKDFLILDSKDIQESCLQMRSMGTTISIISNITSNPHPANNSFAVEFNLLQSVNVEYEIRNQYGNTLFYDNVGLKPVGLLSKKFDTSGLLPGQYSLIIKAGTEVETVSFIVIH